jgi:hypothetical protein
MSCLFDSLSEPLPGENGTTLRSKVCDYLFLNPKLGKQKTTVEKTIGEWWDNAMTLNDYVTEMRKTSTQGTEIEICAFCQLFCAQVTVNATTEKGKNYQVVYNPPGKSVQHKVTIGFVPGHFSSGT